MQSSSLVRVAVVGAGSIGREYALNHFTAAAGCVVSAIVDLDSTKAAALAADVGSVVAGSSISGGGYRSAAREQRGQPVLHAAALNEAVLADCDAVYIGTTPSSHRPLVERALASDKHVLLEKPLASSAADADAIVAAAEAAALQRRATLGMNIGMRYNAALHQLRRLAVEDEAARFGTVSGARIGLHFACWPREWQRVPWCTDRSDGGPLREVGTHFLAATLELWGQHCVRRVRAHVQYPAGDGGQAAAASGGGGSQRAETAVDGALELQSGVIVELRLTTDGSRGGRDVYELEVSGSSGAAYLLRDFTTLVQTRPRRRILVDNADYGRAECVEHLVAAVRAARAPEERAASARPEAEPLAASKKRSREGGGGGGPAAAAAAAAAGVAPELPRPVSAREGRNTQRVLDALLASGGEWRDVCYDD